MPSVRPILTVIAVFCAGVVSKASALPAIVVRGETQVHAEWVDEPNRRLVRVRLSDELGVPLAASRVEVTFGGGPNMTPPSAIAAVTNGRGEAEVAVPDAYAATRATVAFAGAEYYERVEREVVFDRSNPAVVVRVPQDGKLELNRRAHVVAIAAESGWRGELEVGVRDERGRPLGRVRLRDSTSVDLEITSSDLGDPGAGRLVVQSDNGSELAQCAIVRISDTHVRLEMRERGGNVYAEGSVTIDSSTRELPRVPVALTIDDEILRTVVTDDEGRFSTPMEGLERQGARLSARFDSNVEWYRSSVSAPVLLANPWPMTPAQLAAALATIAVVVSLVTSLRRERAKRISTRSTALPDEYSARPPRRELGKAHTLRIVDARTNRPIEGARLNLADKADAMVSDSDGIVRLADENDARLKSTLSADGYETRSLPTDFVRSGLSNVSLMSYRDRVFSLLRQLAPHVAYSAKGPTPREIVRALRGDSDLVDAGRRLVLRIEIAMFGAEPPDAATTAELASELDEWLAKVNVKGDPVRTTDDAS